MTQFRPFRAIIAHMRGRGHIRPIGTGLIDLRVDPIVIEDDAILAQGHDQNLDAALDGLAVCDFGFINQAKLGKPGGGLGGNLDGDDGRARALACSTESGTGCAGR